MKCKRLVLLTVILFQISSLAWSQTCIIILRTPDSIVVGADTKQANFKVIKKADGRIVNDSSNSVLCKIIPVGRFYFAIAGYNSDSEISIARECVRKFKRLDVIVDSFANAYVGQIRQAIDKIQKYPNTDTSILSPLRASSVAFFGIENDTTKLTVVHFIWHGAYFQEPDIQISIKPYPYHEKGLKLITLGHFDAVMKYQGSPEMKKLYIDDRVIALIKKQIQASPAEVGEPIDVLVVPRKGRPRWYKNPNGCSL